MSVADLQLLAQFEADNPVEFGKVGYRFRKQFNEGWFDGIVVKVLSRGGKIVFSRGSLDRIKFHPLMLFSYAFLFLSSPFQRTEKIGEFSTRQTMTLKTSAWMISECLLHRIRRHAMRVAQGRFIAMGRKRFV